MKIVFLDAASLGDDIDFAPFEQMGEVVRYSFTSPEEAPGRTADADVLVVNKVPVNAQTTGTATNLKLVCVTATGTNNLDKTYLAKRNIAWRNVSGYSTEAVAQHTFAMLFYLLEHLKYYDNYVKNGSYINDRCFTHFARTFHELSKMKWGIIGLGAIGRRVADIAGMFGADVVYYSASGAPEQSGYHQVDLDTLLSRSDIVSIHAPLNQYTEGLINTDAFRKMKPNAILLNLGRGPIIEESALAEALNTGKISAAGLDVLSAEPMKSDSPLLTVRDKDRLLITPHIAWAAIEARQRLMKIVENQIRDFNLT